MKVQTAQSSSDFTSKNTSGRTPGLCLLSALRNHPDVNWPLLLTYSVVHSRTVEQSFRLERVFAIDSHVSQQCATEWSEVQQEPRIECFGLQTRCRRRAPKIGELGKFQNARSTLDPIRTSREKADLPQLAPRRPQKPAQTPSTRNAVRTSRLCYFTAIPLLLSLIHVREVLTRCGRVSGMLLPRRMLQNARCLRKPFHLLFLMSVREAPSADNYSKTPIPNHHLSVSSKQIHLFTFNTDVFYCLVLLLLEL